MHKPKVQYQKRRRTYNDPGHAHELTFSCYRRLPLLNKDRTRRWLTETLDRARKRCNFELWAYVIMPEHVHLLLYPRPPDYDVAAILKAIKQPVSRQAVRFLGEHAPHWLTQLQVTRPSGRVEHRFWQQGGGYDRNIHREEVARTSIEYIHDNPVRRGLVSCATDWAWSSARYYAGMDDVSISVDEYPGCPMLGRGRRSPG